MGGDHWSVVQAIDEDETLALLRELIRCPSENPPGGEEATAACLAAYFERHGIPVRLEEILPYRPNVIAELGAEGGPTLVFNGHTDTVPAGPGWTLDPFGADVRDGLVYGRGACDMLAGVAAMSAATVALKRSGVPLEGCVVVHAVIDEEDHSSGSKAAARDVDADWVIVAEPTAGSVNAFGKGQLNVEITFEGKAAHSSRPDEGRNAIHDAAAFVELVEREHRRLAERDYPGVGPVTFSTGLITGGITGSIVPPECTIVIDRRLLPTETLEEAQAHVERLLEEVAAERPGLEFTLRPTLRFPPFPPAPGDELARAVQAAVRDVGAGSGEIGGSRGATDASWYAARGIPTVVFGPGDIQNAHQPDEWVAVDDLRLGTRVLALVAARLVTEATAEE
jgi:acetylornithine deacetylase/succinyl-diaminopimelate desuccinylase family protein